MSEAIYSRRQTDIGYVYEITPAAASGRFSVVGWAVIIVIAAVLGVQAGNTRGIVSVGCAFGAIALVSAFYMKQRNDRQSRSGKTELTISRDALTVGGNSYLLNDIAELMLVDHQGQPRARTVVLVGGSGPVAGMAMAASAGIGVAMAALDAATADKAARSLALAIRRHSDSRPVKIVGYLTDDAAASLMQSIVQTVQAIRSA